MYFETIQIDNKNIILLMTKNNYCNIYIIVPTLIIKNNPDISL